MKILSVIGFVFLFGLAPGQTVLDEYIRAGLENNLALQQKQSDYQVSLQQLKQARGMFYPSISVNARYTVSEGGRVIEFPFGDLLNPVYTTLNQLTASNQFPQLENQEIAFLRPTEHETKLRLVQPVFNSDIYFNARIKKEQLVSGQITLNQYRRELIAEIRKSYYTVGMSQTVLSMLQETRLLLLENIRVNKSLFENSKVTRDILLRSETELHKFDQQLSNALKNRELAVAYFNFLLNRPLQDSIILEDPGQWITVSGTPADYFEQAAANREEIQNLIQYERITNIAVSMNKSGSLPDVFLVADYGFQGEKYVFNKDHDYLQASAIFSWDLFSGLQNRARVKEAVIAKEKIGKQLSELKNQVSLQVISALEDLKTAEAGLVAAEKQLSSAREGFRLVNRKYHEGQANLIEFMDARNSLTQAEENLIISQYSCMIKKAEFDKVIAIDLP